MPQVRQDHQPAVAPDVQVSLGDDGWPESATWPGMEYTRQVSTESGTWQYWKGDSSELVFQGASGNIYSSTIATEDGRLKIGSPEMLFVHRGMQFDGPLIDMTADGQRS